MLLLFSAAILLPLSLACSSSSVGRDSEIITDPTFSFSLSPPVRWTYYPPVAQMTGQTIANYFPGQSDTSQQAINFAQNEIMASYLEALSEANIPYVGSSLSATVTYSPDEISNCYTGTVIPAGTKIGYLAGGAITEIALVTGQGGTGATVTNCPLSTTTVTTGVGPYQEYIKPLSVSTRGGITLSRYSWERVANTMQSILNFRYNALFRTPIVIN